ncbi:helix-turn-helix domain-containing protein [Yeguia hominis]|uniref:Helix-turn-helix transcriptional regulator n=1 Tax=Yeguia hominis TaxID=2763662 RepID=A0A926D9M5_9FIRM|nr:AraC family transcriptional regulator [Yeguia hominis]MBC8533998.1 helix-turn-helix transcriptional regulator [Yeguia hominis]
MQYIETHYGEPVSLEVLSRSANISKSECLRCFKAALQTTPYQYLTGYRLSKAAALLENTDLPITQVADRVGFSQLSHFGKQFKEKTGITPSQYRKKSCGSCF